MIFLSLIFSTLSYGYGLANLEEYCAELVAVIMNITFFSPSFCLQLMTLNMATTQPRPHPQNTMPHNWGQFNTNSRNKTTFKGKIKAK